MGLTGHNDRSCRCLSLFFANCRSVLFFLVILFARVFESRPAVYRSFPLLQFFEQLFIFFLMILVVLIILLFPSFSSLVWPFSFRFSSFLISLIWFSAFALLIVLATTLCLLLKRLGLLFHIALLCFFLFFVILFSLNVAIFDEKLFRLL